MQGLLIFQIIADVILGIAILFLLTRLGRTIGRAKAPVGEDKYLAELGQLIRDSRAEAEHFSRTIEESCIKFKELASNLETQEAKLAQRLEAADQQLAKCYPAGMVQDPDSGDKYSQVISLLRTGVTVREAAQRFSLTEGEVSLIFELDKKKSGL